MMGSNLGGLLKKSDVFILIKSIIMKQKRKISLLLMMKMRIPNNQTLAHMMKTQENNKAIISIPKKKRNKLKLKESKKELLRKE